MKTSIKRGQSSNQEFRAKISQRETLMSLGKISSTQELRKLLKDQARHPRSNTFTERICRIGEQQSLRKSRRRRETLERQRDKMRNGRMSMNMRRKYLQPQVISMFQIPTLTLVWLIRNFFRKWRRLRVQKTVII